MKTIFPKRDSLLNHKLNLLTPEQFTGQVQIKSNNIISKKIIIYKDFIVTVKWKCSS